jgi:UDP-3-O-[3-hydroxymyristoyl] glucosamine N-acyltransferase
VSESAAPGDPRFFARSGPFAIADIVRRAGVEASPHDTQRRFVRVAPLQVAGPDDVSFLDNRKYLSALEATQAGAVIVHPSLAERVPAGCIALVTQQPYLAWARVAALFHPLPPMVPGIHPSAIADPSARIDPSCEIGPFVVIGARVEIGPNCRVGAHSVIGDGVVIGADSRIGAHCTISHAMIGERVTLLPGVRIGQDGFGFASTMTPSGPAHVGVPQLGRVMVESDVEIGANTCIDRGSAQDTVIGAGSRLDNQVQIGHNVRIGRACVIVAQVGIAGSTVLEDFVVLGGQAGLAGHLRIGRGARVAAQSGVMDDLAGGAEYFGCPAQPAKQAFRQIAILRKMARARSAGSAKEQPTPPKAGGEANGN